MSSTILPLAADAADDEQSGRNGRSIKDAAGHKDPLLLALGQRVRTLRARRGLTRDALAAATGVSKRHLANLEDGLGHAGAARRRLDDVLQREGVAAHGQHAVLIQRRGAAESQVLCGCVCVRLLRLGRAPGW